MSPPGRRSRPASDGPAYYVAPAGDDTRMFPQRADMDAALRAVAGVQIQDALRCCWAQGQSRAATRAAVLAVLARQRHQLELAGDLYLRQVDGGLWDGELRAAVGW